MHVNAYAWNRSENSIQRNYIHLCVLIRMWTPLVCHIEKKNWNNSDWKVNSVPSLRMSEKRHLYVSVDRILADMANNTANIQEYEWYSNRTDSRYFEFNWNFCEIQKNLCLFIRDIRKKSILFIRFHFQYLYDSKRVQLQVCKYSKQKWFELNKCLSSRRIDSMNLFSNSTFVGNQFNFPSCNCV